uniref:ceramide glucosyltransferase n=1 Tax=Strongyloides stercoralis TaxID=6248 RepID=A0AAF5DLX8_STRER
MVKEVAEICYANGSKLEFLITNKTTAEEIFTIASDGIEMSESERKYFGIAVVDDDDQYQFLDSTTKLYDVPCKNQGISDKSKLYTLQYALKRIPRNLFSNITSPNLLYLLFLEAKNQLLSGMLPLPNIHSCAYSFAYLLHFLEGPYVNDKLFIIMLRSLQWNHRILKYYNVTEDTFNSEVKKCYIECLSKSKGDVFFELIKLMQQSWAFVGRFYKVKDKMNINCLLGLCEKGIFLVTDDALLKIKKEIPWKDVQNFQMKREWLIIDVDGYKYSFATNNNTACKLLWTEIVKKHQDFLNECSKSLTCIDTVDKSLFIKKYDAFFNQTSGRYSAFLNKSNKYRDSVCSVVSSLSSEMSLKKENNLLQYKKYKEEKENLEIQLIKKLDELKELCIKEAELTGELPKEIYKTLMPGEPEPKINRRVGTTFKISNDILKNLTNEGRNELDKIVQMEVDINVQRAIVNAEKYLSRDKSTHKSIRKKRKKDFVAANEKLKDLEKCLTQERNILSNKEENVIFRDCNLGSPKLLLCSSCPVTPTSSISSKSSGGRSRDLFSRRKLFDSCAVIMCKTFHCSYVNNRIKNDLKLLVIKRNFKHFDTHSFLLVDLYDLITIVLDKFSLSLVNIRLKERKITSFINNLPNHFVLLNIVMKNPSVLFVSGLWLLHILSYKYGKYRLHKNTENLKSYPGVSIIKPLVGKDNNLKTNLETFFLLNYPTYELLFCLNSTDDEAYNIVVELCKKYSNINTKIFIGGENVGLNPKINNMMPAYKFANHSLVLISDSGIYMKKNALTDMVACMGKNIALVTQQPYCKDRSGFAAAFEKVYFGTGHARIYLAGNCLQFTCSTGMSSLMRKDVLDECGGIQAFSQYLAEDYFFGVALAKKGWKSCISHMPALQNASPDSITSFNNRICRWIKLRIAMLPHTIILEPLQECFLSGLLGAIAFNKLFGVNPIFFFLCHIIYWCFWDYHLLCTVENGIPNFTIFQFIILWLLRESLAFPLFFKALIDPKIVWKAGFFKLAWGGKIKKL